MVIRLISPKTKIVLVSASPRRAQLLKKAGFKFNIYHPKARESKFSRGFSIKTLQSNVLKKIAAYPKKLRKDQVLIAADTVVVLDKKVLGKPGSTVQASQFLKLLSGKSHQVYTGLAIHDLKKDRIKMRNVKTTVTFKKLTEDQIRKYVATREPMDKAGGYGIQGGAKKFIQSIRGSYSNVVGLPLECLYIMMKR